LIRKESPGRRITFNKFANDELYELGYVIAQVR